MHEMLTVYLAKIPLASGWPLPEFHRLPELVKAEILAYRQIEDQLRVYTGKRMVAALLADLIPSPEVYTLVEKNTFGKPSLPGGPDFNISHSGDWVAGIRSFKGKVGVDIEQIRPIDIDIFTRQFTPFERQKMQATEDPISAFFDAWTGKEAVMKADGRGMRIPLHAIELAPGHANIAGESGTFWLSPFAMPSGYKGHAATDFPFKMTTEILTFHGE
jgi:4'-phosphopantetheinyl transferase